MGTKQPDRSQSDKEKPKGIKKGDTGKAASLALLEIKM